MDLILPAGKGVIGSEGLTVSNSVKALTASVYQAARSSNFAQKETANFAVISVEAQDLRWSIDPAVTVAAGANGHLAAAGSSICLASATDIKNFRAIRTGGSDSTINVTYFI